MLNVPNGLRKWSIIVLVILASIGLRISGHISSAEFVDLLKFIIPSFMAANLVGKFKKKESV